MLQKYRILDLTDEKGSFCGRMLGDLGADVIKIEPPAGDAARRIGPFPGDTPDLRYSLSWFANNCSKRGITLGLEHEEGRRVFKNLCEGADVVIESFDPGYLDRLGVGFEDLRGLNPRLIMTSITPFGRTGPYRDRKASDIVILAMSGLMSITGDPDRPPVRMCLDQTYYLGGAHGAAATLVALHHRKVSREGQHVDVSLLEAAVRGNYWEPARWEFLKEIVKRAGNRFPRAVAKGLQLWKCRDGYVTWLLTGGVTGAKQMRALLGWMDEKGEAGILKDVDWEGVHLSTVSQEQLSAWEEVIRRFFEHFTMDELMAEAVRRAIPMARLNTVDRIAGDEQLKFREFWQTLSLPGIDAPVTLPAFPYLSTAGSTRVRNRAPEKGEHNEEIYGGDLGFSRETLSSLTDEGII